MIITKEEAYELIKDHYDDEELEVIFAYHKDHPIELVDGGERHRNNKIPRWVQTIDYQNDPNVLDPNQMAEAYYSGKFTQEEYMEYNRQIGYSLYGFWEVFCFNDRFDWDQWEKDKELEKIENRDKELEKISKWD